MNYRHTPKGTPFAERFDWYVIPEPNSGCHLWTGEVNSKGYGRFSDKGGKHRVRYLAHRLAYEMARGVIPKGMRLLHKCDVPCCVNPDHMFIGTQKVNAIDMAKKGRQHLQKLSIDDARSIKLAIRNYRRGMSRQLAERYGVSAATILDIKRGHSWSHIEVGHAGSE